jgi:selenocysteine-specific elongation factor
VESGSASAYGSDPPRWIATDVVPTWAPRASDFVVAHHRAHPLLDGPLLAEVRQALVPVPEARAFEALLPAIESTAGLQVRSGRLARPEHRASPSPEQRAVLDALVRRLHDGGTHPPPLATATSGLDLPPDALLWLVEQGELIKVADDFLVAREPYRTLVRALVRHARATGGLAPADFKELSGLTRRHAMPFLEHFDRERLTVRRADGRTLRDVPPWVDE